MPRQCLLWFQVPALCEDAGASLPEQGSSDSRQKELYRIAMKGNYEAVASLGEDRSLRMCQTPYCPLGWIQRMTAVGCCAAWAFGGEQVVRGDAVTHLRSGACSYG